MNAVTTLETPLTARPPRPDRLGPIVHHWPIVLPALLFASSGIVVLSQNYWGTEQGGHGPIILATGLWLLWNKSAELSDETTRGRTWLAALGILVFGLFAVVAAITVKQFLQVLGIWGALVSLLYLFVGGKGLRKLWAPVLYLLFLVPPPENIIVPLTHTLKADIAIAAVNVLGTLGYPVAQEGATLFIGPYELVVAAACSGLNSLVSLLAIGLFYTYLMHPINWRYAGLLALFIVPVAIFANFVRVMLILLITYYFGDAVGQSFIHDAMGMIVFITAMLTLIAVDKAMYPLLAQRTLGRDRRHREPARG